MASLRSPIVDLENVSHTAVLSFQYFMDSIEGAEGGLAAAVVCAVVISFFLPSLGVLDAIALGVLAGAAGQAGDLWVSVLKRSSGVKDAGGILPGHGGILDRADALAFTAPATWAFGHFIAGF